MGVVTAKNKDDRRAHFLLCLANGDSVKHACEISGIGRKTAYVWRAQDPEFAEAWDEATEAGVERLEDEAYRRALVGSDTLMIFLLKAKRPKVYADKQRLEHTGPNGGPLQVQAIERRIIDPDA